MNKLYNCSGLGEEYIGTAAEFSNYFKRCGYNITSQELKVGDNGKDQITFMVETENGNEFDVCLYPVKSINHA